MDTPKLTFEQRAKAYEADIKPLIEKWKVMPWAGLQTSLESITAVPLLRDLENESTPAG